MTRKARIEYQDQFGDWQYLTTVTAVRINIRLALKRALAIQACRGRARALDDEDGSMIDMDFK
ncbi:MAG TPA: hypothetical protein VIJ16_10665 [Gemmatimonadaceae bacterium]